MRILVLLFSLSGFLPAQQSFFDALCARGDTVTLEVTTDWHKLIRNKKDKTYQPLQLSHGDETFGGRIRSRGNIRLEVCQYPSLKIKLTKKDLAKEGYSDLNELKLVLQCSSSSIGESYLRNEKLMYDLHAVVSNYAHRTVPCRLVVNGQDTISAFLVEDEEQLAARYDARIIKVKKLSTQGLHRESYVNSCMFNYMILNCDWHVFNLHNLEFINPAGTLDIIPIPYDFDYSGMVGTSYAIPHEGLDIASVYEPKWLGKDVSEGEMLASAAHFIRHRDLLIRTVTNHPDLKASDRRRMLNRLDDFFSLVERKKRLLKLL